MRYAARAAARAAGAVVPRTGVVDIAAAARALGCRYAASTADLAAQLAELRARGGPSLLELRVRPGNRPDLGRPTRTPSRSKQAFMAALRRGAR